MTTDLPRLVYESRLKYDWEKDIAIWHDTHKVTLIDHLGGFNEEFKNSMLDKVPAGVTVQSAWLLPQHIKNSYPDLDIRFDAELMIATTFLKTFVNRVVPKTHKLENFLCSFFRSSYPGRVWLLCWLYELGWINFDYASKFFVIDEYPNEIRKLYAEQIGDDFDSRSQQRHDMMKYVGSLGPGEPCSHHTNLTSLSSKIQKSFVCVVAETEPAKYLPFPSEKFLYPIANSTLWLAYAQPEYHRFVKEHLGFKMYDCFDYHFDSIIDPIDRLSALTAALKPFSTMTPDQWADVYRSQQAIIQFNADNVRSGNFIKTIQQFDEVAR